MDLLRFKHQCYAAGMKPDEYYNACFCDALEMIRAHEMNKANDMRIAREIFYMIYCTVQPEDKRVSKIEMCPLPGDRWTNAHASREQMIKDFQAAGVLGV